MRRFSLFILVGATLVAVYVVNGCGTKNLFPGSASKVLLMKEAYYANNYSEADRIADEIIGDASTSSTDIQEARLVKGKSNLALAGGTIVDIAANVQSKIKDRSDQKAIGGVLEALAPPTDATKRAQIIQAAVSLQQANISTQAAEAVPVAVANAQAAQIKLIDAFAGTGKTSIETSDVEKLTTTEVAAKWFTANSSSDAFGASGGVTSFLNTTINYGSGGLGQGVQLISGEANTSGSLEAIHKNILEGKVSGAELAKFLKKK